MGGPFQSNFILGRLCGDNIVVAQEIFHSARKKRGAKWWVAIKMDLKKAYDKLIWNFIEDTLYDIGMPKNVINLI